MIFDEFDICYGAYKIVKHDLKHLDNICSWEILGKDSNLFDEKYHY